MNNVDVSSSKLYILTKAISSLTPRGEKVLLKDYALSKTCNREEVSDFASAIYDDALRFYSERNLLMNVAVFNFLIEPVKNARYHSDNLEQEIIVGLALSRKAMIAGFNDGGSYFGKLDVKRCWESKIRHEEKHLTNEPTIGFSIGTRIMYEMSDFIMVDALQRTMYAGIRTENSRFFSSMQ